VVVNADHSTGVPEVSDPLGARAAVLDHERRQGADTGAGRFTVSTTRRSVYQRWRMTVQ
jgi:hypothetical protein